MRKILLFLFLTFFSFTAEAALQRSEVYKSVVLPNGYWALNTMTVDFPAQSAYITIALYKDAAAYLAAPSGNKLREWDYGYTISGAEFGSIFSQNKSVQEIVFLIFNHIKEDQPDEDSPPPFADAEIVP